MNFPQDASAPSAAGGNLTGESDELPETFPSLELKKILVPTDFSANSKKALIYAVRLAQRNYSSLILFHVVQPPEFVRQLHQDYSYQSNEERRKQFEMAMRLSAEGLERLSRAVGVGNIKIEASQHLGTPYSFRTAGRVQGRYPHGRWIPHGRAIPSEALIAFPEPLIAHPEPMLPKIELSLWSKLLSLALCVEKANLLMKGHTSHRHSQRSHKEKI